jgi:hypothetical protein
MSTGLKVLIGLGLFGMLMVGSCTVIAIAAGSSTKAAATSPPLSESCFEVSKKFGAGSTLSDLQKDELWKDYRGKSFEWDLKITEVSSNAFGGFSVQAKCAPDSTSLIQDIQLSYDDKLKSKVMAFQKGETYKVTGKLTVTSSLLGLMGDGT